MAPTRPPPRLSRADSNSKYKRTSRYGANLNVHLSENATDAKPQPQPLRQFASISTINSDWNNEVHDSRLPVLTSSRSFSSLKNLGQKGGKRRPSEPAYLEGLTEQQKQARKEAEKRALQENPRADPEFCFLPKGMNNKIVERDLFVDKFRRMFRRRRKRVKPLDRSRPPPTPQLGVANGVKRNPVPTRYCPPVAPAREVPKLERAGSFSGSQGGEFLVNFSETPEEIQQRIKASQLEAELRAATERRLKLAGREHLSDPKIGRAPPFSRRALAEPALRRRSRERRRSKGLPEAKPKTPFIPDRDPREINPDTQDRAFMWDKAFLADKKGYSQPGDRPTDLPNPGSPKVELPQLEKAKVSNIVQSPAKDLKDPSRARSRIPSAPRREAPIIPGSSIPPLPRRSSKRKNTLLADSSHQTAVGLGIYSSSERRCQLGETQQAPSLIKPVVKPLEPPPVKEAIISKSSEFDGDISRIELPDLSKTTVGTKVEKNDSSKVPYPAGHAFDASRPSAVSSSSRETTTLVDRSRHHLVGENLAGIRKLTQPEILIPRWQRREDPYFRAKDLENLRRPNIDVDADTLANRQKALEAGTARRLRDQQKKIEQLHLRSQETTTSANSTSQLYQRGRSTSDSLFEPTTTDNSLIPHVIPSLRGQTLPSRTAVVHLRKSPTHNCIDFSEAQESPIVRKTHDRGSSEPQTLTHRADNSSDRPNRKEGSIEHHSHHDTLGISHTYEVRASTGINSVAKDKPEQFQALSTQQVQKAPLGTSQPLLSYSEIKPLALVSNKANLVRDIGPRPDSYQSLVSRERGLSQPHNRSPAIVTAVNEQAKFEGLKGRQLPFTRAATQDKPENFAVPTAFHAPDQISINHGRQSSKLHSSPSLDEVIDDNPNRLELARIRARPSLADLRKAHGRAPSNTTIDRGIDKVDNDKSDRFEDRHLLTQLRSDHERQLPHHNHSSVIDTFTDIKPERIRVPINLPPLSQRRIDSDISLTNTPTVSAQSPFITPPSGGQYLPRHKEDNFENQDLHSPTEIKTPDSASSAESFEQFTLSAKERARQRVARIKARQELYLASRAISHGSPISKNADPNTARSSLTSAQTGSSHRNSPSDFKKASKFPSANASPPSPKPVKSTFSPYSNSTAQAYSSSIAPRVPKIQFETPSRLQNRPSTRSRLPQPGSRVAQTDTCASKPNLDDDDIPPNIVTSFSTKSFLDNCLTASGAHTADMDRLQVRNSVSTSVKTKAVEDARQMQATVLETATKEGKDPPKYVLIELIGKGSFGRVYKGKDMTSAAIVAVKIIDIDESDTINPKNADSYSEFLKEVNALKTLSENKARNINVIIEALPVGQAMWMITEYCGGGSVATLMKPTAPGGLQEKWIIPILREVAEAVKWVHEAGIIHRDIKCANVLITEEGGVQLCDFGVAGTMETKVDKRSTIIGTPHWMAPELFDATPSYGKEVDIWAFGSMVYEIATGLPPNAANRIPFERLGPHLKQHVPRLEGGDYSDDLRSLVAYCLEEFPSERPAIDEVQKHPYIHNTQSRYPMSSLSHLVRAFKLWEDHGGSRKSLFMLGGAQGPSELSSTAMSDDEWNFSTTAAFEQEVRRQSTAQDVYDVYGSGVDFDLGFAEQTSRPPPAQKGRRRPPPEALAPLKAPLEKIFDPNTLSNYEENSRNHYGRPFQQPSSDLPLRDDSTHTSIRDTMIDLGGHDIETGMSSFPDMETIKAGRRGQEDEDDDYMATLPDFSRPALSDPADINPNRRTQDWKFPSMAPPASADPELSRFPSSYEVPRPSFTPGVGGRPGLTHHPTEPLGTAFSAGLPGAAPAATERMSIRESLIDLDMSLPDPVPEFVRPSTAESDAASIRSVSSDSLNALTSSTVNPFELERHASLYKPAHEREPSIYVTDEFNNAPRARTGNALNDLADVSDFSASDEGGKDDASDSDYATAPAQAPSNRPRGPNAHYTMAHFPDLPPAPSARALTGEATHDEMAFEITRMLNSLTGQLEAFRDVYESPAVARRPSRRQNKDSENGV